MFLLRVLNSLESSEEAYIVVFLHLVTFGGGLSFLLV